MRTPYATALLLTMLLGGTYWFSSAQAICNIPLAYRIAEVDPRFGLSFDDARLAVGEAESLWENATGQNLFNYDPDASFVVRFIYDERQAFTDAEERFRSALDTSVVVNDDVRGAYEALVTRYNALRADFTARRATYEAELTAYNAEVASYNETGGAPEAVYAELEATRERLNAEASAIAAEVRNLNRLVDEINDLSERGNELIENYNDRVATYNQTFGESHEFTQGDYQGTEINIYTFTDTDELQLVLAHELGHALSLEHALDAQAVMHNLIGEQSIPVALTAADLELFEQSCGEVDKVELLREKLRVLLSWLNG